MLIQIFLQLILSLLMGLGPLFGVEAQVLCIEKDGHAVLESFAPPAAEVALPTKAGSELSLCAESSHKCPGCHDILLGPVQRSAIGPQHHADGQLAQLPQLQLIDLSLRPLPAPHALPPPAPRRFAAFVPIAAPPRHLPSTLLLI